MRLSILLAALAMQPACALAQAAAGAASNTGGSRGLPDWLSLKGEARVRYESLEGQFRAGRDGSDQLLLFRTVVSAEADAGPVAFGLEVQDSRTYLGDAGTPLSGGFTNPLDLIGAYARFENLPCVWGGGGSSTLTLGRQTVSIASKRQIERVDFANVIRSFTGAHLIATADRGDVFHALHVVPNERLPTRRPGVDDNDPVGDKEQWGRRIWALHYRRADLLPKRAPGLWGEVFVYGLEEEDTGDLETPDRSYVAPGARLYRRPRVGQWDVEVEGALRQGSRYATNDPDDTQGLEVDASMLFAALGYTFDGPWQPRFAFEYYFASGDDDPDDLRFDQHERLFGSRRSDLNNTSIHGPLTPANLNAPGFRIEVKPNPRWDGRINYHAAYLASATDSWVIARLRDPTGQSGDFIGHTLDGRVRYWMVPDRARLEVGASGLLYGGFPKTVPGGPGGDGTLFGYVQVTTTF